MCRRGVDIEAGWEILMMMIFGYRNGDSSRLLYISNVACIIGDALPERPGIVTHV